MRLIDADKILAKMETVMDMQDVYLPVHFLEMVTDDMPTIEAEPVRRGHWDQGVKTLKFNKSCQAELLNAYNCSECGWECNCDKKLDFKFCPNCGAKMDLEEQK